MIILVLSLAVCQFIMKKSCFASVLSNLSLAFGILPAGFLENGEIPETGAMRETREESLAKVEILKLHCVFSLPKVNQVYLHFLAKLDDNNFGPTSESLEVKLFGHDEIPWEDIAFHSSTFALEKFLEHGLDFQGVHIGNYEGKQKWEE